MDIRAILAGLAFALIWSSAFTSARIIVADAPPILSLSLRFLISGLIGIALARFLGQTWRLTPGQWRATIVFGLCQNALYLGLNFVAMQTVEASLASIIASTMPLAVGFAGWVIFRERLSALGVLGLCAGAGGVALIMGARMQAGADFYGIASVFHRGGFADRGDFDGARRLIGGQLVDDRRIANAGGVGFSGHSGPYS
jgi:drug/metabolite transporter (DMT)-like permease